MMNHDTAQAILSLKEKGIPTREISRILQVSRNTVRRVLRGNYQPRPQRASRYENLAPLIQETLKRCKGNAVRVREILLDTHGQEVPYSTLTRMVRDLELREDKPRRRSGIYEYGLGEETQHDTSPHQVILGGKKVKAQCAALVLAYSRKLFVQYYPNFTRFEANENNFLAGRSFTDWHDLNTQVRNWCIEVANRKIKRSLGMSPEAAYVMEKPHLQSLPPHIPPVYQTLYRGVDVAGYVQVDTNRYSVPERLIGKEVEIHKLWDRIEIFWKHQKVADHERLIDKKETRITAQGHHPPLHRHKAHCGPCKEEMSLRGHSEGLDRYVEEIKKHSPGRAIRQMRRLLDLKRTYPPESFCKAIEQALHYRMVDLARLEQIILSHVAGDFFNNIEEDETS